MKIMKKQITRIAAVLMALALCFTCLPAEAQAASKVRLNKTRVTLYTNGSTTLKVSGTSKKVKFTSNRKSVAAVTSKGKVTAKKPGTAVITAKTGSKKLTCKVTVKKENPKLSKTRTTLYAGKSTTLKVSGTSRKAKFTSSKKSVATVSSSGKITGKKPGTAVITAKVGSKRLTCKVTVKAKAPKLNKTSETVLISYSKKLSVSGNTGKVIWKSSKPSVAKVDSRGVVTGKKAGTATITAKVDGKSLKCKVMVPKYRLHTIGSYGDEDGNPVVYTIEKDIRKVTIGSDTLLGHYQYCRLGLSGVSSKDTVTWELAGSKRVMNAWGGMVERNAKAGIDGRKKNDELGYKVYRISNINDSVGLPYKNGSTELRVKINGKTMFKVKIKSVAN